MYIYIQTNTHPTSSRPGSCLPCSQLRHGNHGVPPCAQVKAVCVRIARSDSNSHYNADPRHSSCRYGTFMLGCEPLRVGVWACQCGRAEDAMACHFGRSVRALRYCHRRRRSGDAAACTRTRALDGVGMAPSTRVRRARIVRPLRGGRAAKLRAPLCAGFVIGAFDANYCPPGFSKIVTEAACASAAAALGREYKNPTADTQSPSGCILKVYFGTISVLFNAHPTGEPSAYAQLLCAGAAADLNRR